MFKSTKGEYTLGCPKCSYAANPGKHDDDIEYPIYMGDGKIAYYSWEMEGLK